jgi:hypothetical protein
MPKCFLSFLIVSSSGPRPPFVRIPRFSRLLLHHFNLCRILSLQVAVQQTIYI